MMTCSTANRLNSTRRMTSSTSKHKKNTHKAKKTPKSFADSKKVPTFALAYEITQAQTTILHRLLSHATASFYRSDPLAQLVEHNTFNVGVLGSSPKRITTKTA